MADQTILLRYLSTQNAIHPPTKTGVTVLRRRSALIVGLPFLPCRFRLIPFICVWCGVFLLLFSVSKVGGEKKGVAGNNFPLRQSAHCPSSDFYLPVGQRKVQLNQKKKKNTKKTSAEMELFINIRRFLWVNACVCFCLNEKCGKLSAINLLPLLLLLLRRVVFFVNIVFSTFLFVTVLFVFF